MKGSTKGRDSRGKEVGEKKERVNILSRTYIKIPHEIRQRDDKGRTLEGHKESSKGGSSKNDPSSGWRFGLGDAGLGHLNIQRSLSPVLVVHTRCPFQL